MLSYLIQIESRHSVNEKAKGAKHKLFFASYLLPGLLSTRRAGLAYSQILLSISQRFLAFRAEVLELGIAI